MLIANSLKQTIKYNFIIIFFFLIKFFLIRFEITKIISLYTVHQEIIVLISYKLKYPNCLKHFLCFIHTNYNEQFVHWFYHINSMQMKNCQVKKMKSVQILIIFLLS